jgi:hypothetical protein
MSSVDYTLFISLSQYLLYFLLSYWSRKHKTLQILTLIPITYLIFVLFSQNVRENFAEEIRGTRTLRNAALDRMHFEV